MMNPAAATFAEEDAATLAQPITDITPVTRIKEFHDGENVEWGSSTKGRLADVYLHQIG